jgi:hypothetical protein
MGENAIPRFTSERDSAPDGTERQSDDSFTIQSYVTNTTTAIDSHQKSPDCYNGLRHATVYYNPYISEYHPEHKTATSALLNTHIFEARTRRSRPALLTVQQTSCTRATGDRPALSYQFNRDIRSQSYVEALSTVRFLSAFPNTLN